MWHSILLVALAVCSTGPNPQDASGSPELSNPGFEEGAVGESPAGWTFFSRTGGRSSTVAEGAYEGDQCAFIDASEPSGEGDRFANLMQSLEAEPWRGKRLRYRAMVHTADVDADSRVQMWFRVDRQPGLGAGADDADQGQGQRRRGRHHLEVGGEAQRAQGGGPQSN